jgi:hypothetical protein
VKKEMINGWVVRCRSLIVVSSLLFLAGCAGPPPKNPDNLCSVFDDKWSWERSAKRAERSWNSPIPVMMAIMKQESAYVDDARPPRVRFLGIPLWRKSSSYGYAQAKDETWRWYEQSIGKNRDRDDFSDAIDFIGWYNNQSVRTLGISRTDAFSLYLAYHEGHGGYRQRTYQGKQWLINVAARVRDQAARYSQQYQGCS